MGSSCCPTVGSEDDGSIVPTDSHPVVGREDSFGTDPQGEASRESFQTNVRSSGGREGPDRSSFVTAPREGSFVTEVRSASFRTNPQRASFGTVVAGKDSFRTQRNLSFQTVCKDSFATVPNSDSFAQGVPVYGERGPKGYPRLDEKSLRQLDSESIAKRFAAVRMKG
mmetsp:Transcript_12201/g.34599  ORF Transcript_12201/g.34599 Transcript_12201/m.34599 type:complete len:168 (-) Transcript_12201:138-641(-)